MKFGPTTRRRLDAPLCCSRVCNEFCRKWIDSTLRSLSVATTRTLRVLPPSVAISALSVVRWRDLRIWTRSGMRSERSSQHNEALNMSRPSPPLPSPPVDRTEISSFSEGNVSDWVISDICCFNSFNLSTTLAKSEALSVWTKSFKSYLTFFMVLNISVLDKKKHHERILGWKKNKKKIHNYSVFKV